MYTILPSITKPEPEKRTFSQILWTCSKCDPNVEPEKNTCLMVWTWFEYVPNYIRTQLKCGSLSVEPEKKHGFNVWKGFEHVLNYIRIQLKWDPKIEPEKNMGHSVWIWF